jgi:hypothetical protein
MKNYAVAALLIGTVISIGQADGTVLRTGTPITLNMSETITPKGKKLRVGFRPHRIVMAKVTSPSAPPKKATVVKN